MSDTIFAQATAAGRAGLAVIRISGPEAFAALETLAGGLPRPRTTSLRWLREPASGARLDEAIVTTFPGPASFTGEDVAELSVHGSPAVCRAVLGALGAQPGLRMADPGEFTRRALVNGRLDLAQVEGLGDLLAAETAAQQRQALRLMHGALSGRAAGWRETLVHVLALVEASIDFADEDLPPDFLVEAQPTLAGVRTEMQREAAGTRAAERVRDGFEVALVGAPNVGKSTLLNAIAGREAALTSEIAGTTRDVLEVRLDLHGLPVTLLDMAGVRPATDRIEALGVARARSRAAAADVRVFLVEPGADAAGIGVRGQPGDLTVGAKADLCASGRGDGLAVSGLTGAGIDALLSALAEELARRASLAGTASHERHRLAIERAATAVGAAAGLVGQADKAELAAEELRAALRALDVLVGKVDVESVLDVIFRSFCLGK